MRTKNLRGEEMVVDASGRGGGGAERAGEALDYQTCLHPKTEKQRKITYECAACIMAFHAMILVFGYFFMCMSEVTMAIRCR